MVLLIVDVVEQKDWICIAVPLPLFWRGRRWVRPDDFIPWKRGVSL
jgi:hypothetical protein